MDSQGNLHANRAALEAMEEQLAEAFTPTEDMPADAIEISDPKVAAMLAGMNRRARLVYRSERRRGASEEEALGAAEGSY
jgi:collagenase-like PrtC family protease